MKELKINDNIIQTGYRMKIPKIIINNTNIKIGQKLNMRYDVNKKSLIIEFG